MAHSKLNDAKSAKNDEFYTQLPDIENELRHYREHFRGRTILCNCDDPYESNFFKYFALNFNSLGLRKLIATCYSGRPVYDLELDFFGDVDLTPVVRTPHKIVITEVPDMNNDGAIDLLDVKLLLQSKRNVLTRLSGDGDFRSAECIELLKEADIVVTNPPFSLFREYIAQLVEYDKKFIILGTLNAFSYKDIFPLIKTKKIWSGYGFNLSMVFKTPYENNLDANRKYVKGKGYDPDKNYIKTPAICWFTNLDIRKRHEELILYKHYTPEEYPKYENFDAIDVNNVSEIPCDYEGLMGVPVTFLGKHNPNQFEIIGLGIANLGLSIGVKPYKLEHKEYRKKIQKRGAVDGDLYMLRDGELIVPYTRIIIRRIK